MKRAYRGQGVWVIVALAGMVALTGCSRGGDDADDLPGSKWVLESLGSAPVLDDVLITMELAEDGNLFGSGGCNRYTGTWESESDNALALRPGGMTLIGCPEDIDNQEQAFLEALSTTDTFRLEDNTLTLRDASGDTIATLIELEPAALVDTPWQLTYVNNGDGALVGIAEGTSITATFQDDGALNGSAGCNTYMTSYEIDGDAISIEPPATTRMACEKEVMDQEFAYLTALEQAASHEIGVDTLTLRSSDGAALAHFTAGE
jgi:heat shock protein HslJ